MLLCLCHHATKISLSGVTEYKNSSRMEVDIALPLTDILRHARWALVNLGNSFVSLASSLSRYCPFRVVTSSNFNVTQSVLAEIPICPIWSPILWFVHNHISVDCGDCGLSFVGCLVYSRSRSDWPWRRLRSCRLRSGSLRSAPPPPPLPLKSPRCPWRITKCLLTWRASCSHAVNAFGMRTYFILKWK